MVVNYRCTGRLCLSRHGDPGISTGSLSGRGNTVKQNLALSGEGRLSLLNGEGLHGSLRCPNTFQNHRDAPPMTRGGNWRIYLMGRNLVIPDRSLYHQKERIYAHYHFGISRLLLSVWNSTAGGYYRQLVPTRANLRSGMPHQNNPSACIESSTRGGCAAGRNNYLYPPGPHGSEDGR